MSPRFTADLNRTVLPCPEDVVIESENENDFVITEHDYSKLYREFLNILGNN
jgi:hypothetical protein